jgi:hypothetical protein
MTSFVTNFACTVQQSYPPVWGVPTWYKYLKGYDDPVTGDCVPFGPESFNFTDLNQVLGIGLALIEILLFFIAIAAVIYVIYGGFQYLISQGEPDRTQAAKNTILNALIGLTVAIMANVIVAFIGTRLTT